MSIKNKDIRAILGNGADTDAQVKALLDLIHGEIDSIRDELDDTRAKLEKAEKDVTTANAAKEKAEKEYNDYKQSQTAKETRASKEAAFKAAAKEAGIAEKYIATVAKASAAEIDALELDDKGTVKDAKKLGEALKETWKDFISTTRTDGAKVETPPANVGAKPTRESIMSIKDAGDRQKAIAENIDLFQ